MKPFIVTFVLLLSIPSALAQSAENVLVVANDASPLSVDIGQYYVQKRGVPKEQLLRIKAGTQDAIERRQYLQQIEGPIASWITRNSAHDRILYIVLTKGIPLRVNGESGPQGTVASVDSELTLLYRKMTGAAIPEAGRLQNPYFLGDGAQPGYKPFSHVDHDIFLVTRLDGYTFEDIRGLIDRGSVPSKDGKILLDKKDAGQGKGNLWLQSAADKLQATGQGDRVVLDSTTKVLTDIKGVLGYYSWGSNDPAIRIRDFRLTFVPGALAATFVSSDGRTFTEPPAGWMPGRDWEDRSRHFAGSPQSLVADFLRAGATGVAGHVAEPYLEATIRPDILFPAYLSGANLAEAFYHAMPYLSWQTVVVGDPLCAPFREKGLASEEIYKGISPETELPVLFSARRVRIAAVSAYEQARVLPEVIKLVIRSEVRLAKGDQATAKKLLEEATAKDSRLNLAQLTLASLYETSGEYDKALARYKLLHARMPDNPLVLNNLAYALAVRKNNIQEALPLAEKAYSLGQGNANIVDTLGWIYHLSGRNEDAARLLAEAVQTAGNNAEIQLHAAVVFGALNRMDDAQKSLARALEIDPKLESREEVTALRKKMK